MSSSAQRILLVDDHQDTLDLFAFVLTQAGYQIMPAASFELALKLARASSYHLFILDSRLADGSGVDLCRSIRADGNLTPILFCSGLAYENNKLEALNAGAQAYLVKPVSISLMCETVAELILKSQKHSEPLGENVKRKASGDLAARMV